MDFFKISKNQCGSTLISALLLVTMTSALIIFEMSSSQNLIEFSLKAKNQVGLINIQKNIHAIISDSQSWKNTLDSEYNTFQTCIEDFSLCKSYIETPNKFNLIDSSGDIVISAREKSWYNREGQLCAANTLCPYYVEIKWRPLCSSINAICSQVELHTSIFEGSGGKDSEIYSFKMVSLKNLQLGLLSPGDKILTEIVPDAEVVVDQIPIKLFIIIDSSASMKDNYAKVKNGIVTFLSSLKDKDVTVYFYTTTSLSIPNGTYNYPEDFKQQVGLTSAGNTYDGFNKVATYEIVKLSDDQYKAHLAPDFSKKLGLSVNSKMDENILLTNIGTILNSISPDEPGSDYESGICAISRIIYDEGPNKVLNQGDHPYFVVFTDEEDYMFDFVGGYPDKAPLCYNDDTQKQTIGTGGIVNCDPLTELCDYSNMYFESTGTTSALEFSYLLNDTIKTSKILGALCQLRHDPADCPYKTTGTFPCDDNAITVLKKYIEPEAQILNCDMTIRTDVVGIIEYISLDVSYPDVKSMLAAKNCELPFTYNGVSYTSGKNYFETKFGVNRNYLGCNLTFKKTQQITYNRFYKTLIDGTYLDNFLGAYFHKWDSQFVESFKLNVKQKLDADFGPTNYGVSFFIHDQVKDQGLCALTNGEYGEAYKDFLTTLNNPNSAYNSLCLGSYDVPLSGLASIISSGINSVIKFDQLAASETIIKVEVKRNGALISLSLTDYQITGNSVSFVDGILQAGDEVIAHVKI